MALTQKVKEAIDKKDVSSVRTIFDEVREPPAEFLRQARVPGEGKPLLFYAVQKQAHDIARYFVEELGADPLQNTDDQRSNPIQQATLLRDEEMLRILFGSLSSERALRNAIVSVRDAFFFYQMNKSTPDKDLIDFILSNDIDLTPPRQFRDALSPETMEWIASFPERKSQAVKSAMIKKNVPQDVESIVRRFSGLQGGRRRKTRRRKGYTKRASKKQ